MTNRNSHRVYTKALLPESQQKEAVRKSYSMHQNTLKPEMQDPLNKLPEETRYTNMYDTSHPILCLTLIHVK